MWLPYQKLLPFVDPMELNAETYNILEKMIKIYMYKLCKIPSIVIKASTLKENR